jgi:hypothetical protein
MSLFTREQLERMFNHEQARQRAELVRKHAAMQPRPKTKAEILVEVAREFAPATVAELAEASGMSQSWVRRHLRTNGITPAKPVHQRKEVKA